MIEDESETKFDLPFAYYFRWDCPDRHIAEAMRVLLCARLQDGVDDGQSRESAEFPEHEAARIRWLIAVNPNTPPVVLDWLVHDATESLLARIAENPRTGSITLGRLAFHPAASVRAAVAENANAPLETILMLAGDESADVRYTLAESYHLPLDVLSFLTEDENPYVAHRARATLHRIEMSGQEAEVWEFPSLGREKKVINFNRGAG